MQIEAGDFCIAGQSDYQQSSYIAPTVSTNASTIAKASTSPGPSSNATRERDTWSGACARV